MNGLLIYVSPFAKETNKQAKTDKKQQHFKNEMYLFHLSVHL